MKILALCTFLLLSIKVYSQHNVYTFISITENNADEDSLKAFLENKDFNYQVLDRGEALTAIPKNLFIDRKGVLRYIQANY